MTFDFVKDVSQEAVWLVAAAGGCVAAFKAITKMRQSTNQRHQELRWRRAQAASDVIQKIHDHPRAAAAVTMLDWNEGKHNYTLGGKHITVSYSDVLRGVGRHPSEILPGVVVLPGVREQQRRKGRIHSRLLRLVSLLSRSNRALHSQ